MNGLNFSQPIIHILNLLTKLDNVSLFYENIHILSQDSHSLFLTPIAKKFWAKLCAYKAKIICSFQFWQYYWNTIYVTCLANVKFLLGALIRFLQNIYQGNPFQVYYKVKEGNHKAILANRISNTFLSAQNNNCVAIIKLLYSKLVIFKKPF